MSIIHKKILFKDVLLLPLYSSFHILSHQISPDSTSNGSNSTDIQGTSNLTFKLFLVTLSIKKNGNNSIAVGKAVNFLMKANHIIEVDANKVKIAPRISKQPSLEVPNYIKGEKYDKAEVGK